MGRKKMIKWEEGKRWSNGTEKDNQTAVGWASYVIDKALFNSRGMTSA